MTRKPSEHAFASNSSPDLATTRSPTTSSCASRWTPTLRGPTRHEMSLKGRTVVEVRHLSYSQQPQPPRRPRPTRPHRRRHRARARVLHRHGPTPPHRTLTAAASRHRRRGPPTRTRTTWPGPSSSNSAAFPTVPWSPAGRRDRRRRRPARWRPHHRPLGATIVDHPCSNEVTRSLTGTAPAPDPAKAGVRGSYYWPRSWVNSRTAISWVFCR